MLADIEIVKSLAGKTLSVFVCVGGSMYLTKVFFFLLLLSHFNALLQDACPPCIHVDLAQLPRFFMKPHPHNLFIYSQ